MEDILRVGVDLVEDGLFGRLPSAEAGLRERGLFIPCRGGVGRVGCVPPLGVTEEARLAAADGGGTIRGEVGTAEDALLLDGVPFVVGDFGFVLAFVEVGVPRVFPPESLDETLSVDVEGRLLRFPDEPRITRKGIQFLLSCCHYPHSVRVPFRLTYLLKKTCKRYITFHHKHHHIHMGISQTLLRH